MHRFAIVKPFLKDFQKSSLHTCSKIKMLPYFFNMAFFFISRFKFRHFNMLYLLVAPRH